jgi:hypothetical protein
LHHDQGNSRSPAILKEAEPEWSTGRRTMRQSSRPRRRPRRPNRNQAPRRRLLRRRRLGDVGSGHGQMSLPGRVDVSARHTQRGSAPAWSIRVTVVSFVGRTPQPIIPEKKAATMSGSGGTTLFRYCPLSGSPALRRAATRYYLEARLSFPSDNRGTRYERPYGRFRNNGDVLRYFGASFTFGKR